jgi:hypothetical protein
MYYPDKSPPGLLPATARNKKVCLDWIEQFFRPGGTDPADALIRAFALHPKTVFLLTDGEFSPGVLDVIRQHNRGEAVVNTVAFVDRAGEPLLKQISHENRGDHKFVP